MRFVHCTGLALTCVAVSCTTIPAELAGLRYHIAEYEADVDAWFGGHTLQAKPPLSGFTNLAYKKPRFEPGTYTASLEANTYDFFDGELTLEVTGRRVADSKSPGGTPKIKNYSFEAVARLEADASSGGFFKIQRMEFTAKPRTAGAAFKDAVEQEMEDLLTAWLDEVEGKLVQAFAGDNPPPTLDGAMVIVQDEVKYKEVDKTETDPETGEEETVKVYEPYVLDRWVLFVAKQVP